MSSAAVIGRQLRQQNTGRSGPQPGKGRQRTASHQLTNAQLQQLKKEEEKKKISTIQSIRNKITFQCLWLTCKALSGGMILLIIGTTMSVVGFYANRLSTKFRQSGNSTIEVINEDRLYHLHNLTYVGPIIMGLGGFAVVAAFVLMFENHESNSKIAPVADDRNTADSSLLTSLLIDDKSKIKPKGQCASVTYLCVSQMSDLPAHPFEKPSVTSANRKTMKPSINAEDASSVAHTKSEQKKDPTDNLGTKNSFPNKGAIPPPNLPILSREDSTFQNERIRKRELMMHLCLDEFVPSPQDIQIIDPDGCDTPRRDTLPPTLDMEVYVSKCPVTVQVQVKPLHLASMESDGLSDSDLSEADEIARNYRRDMNFSEQKIPLLGRCSPTFTSHEFRQNQQPVKLDSNWRYPLLRQGALDGGKNINTKLETT